MSEWSSRTWVLPRSGCLNRVPRAPAWEHGLLPEGRGRRLHSGKSPGRGEAGATALLLLFNLGFFLGKRQASPNHSQTQIREGKQRRHPEERRWREGGATPRARLFRKTLRAEAGTSDSMLKMESSGTLRGQLSYPWNGRFCKTRGLTLDFSETDDSLVMIPGL